MTRIIDPLNEQQELSLQEDEELVNLLQEDPVEESQSLVEEEKEGDSAVEGQVTEAETPPAYEAPAKYSNKSLADVVQMHQEAEKLLGRQSTEVGELRGIVDTFIKNKADEVKVDKNTEGENAEADFFDNPRAAVSKAISESNEIMEMRKIIAEKGQQEVLSKLSSKHPNYEDTIKDPLFGEWVKNSAVRVELLQRADAYDFNAADELLSNWKERKGTLDKAKEVNDKDRKQQRKAATTGGKGSGEPISRKIYKRSEIVTLMQKNPQKYMDNVEEIDKAYAEGRVR